MSLRNPVLPFAGLPLASGRYHIVGGSQTTSTSQPANGGVRVSPFMIPNACTLVRIGADIATAGSAGCTYRLVIYSDNGSGYPGALALNAGTIAGDSATVQEITINLPLGPGIYWFGGVTQGAPATLPFIRSIGTSGGSGSLAIISLGTTIYTAGVVVFGYNDTSGASVIPDPYSSTVTIGSIAPRLFVKTA